MYSDIFRLILQLAGGGGGGGEDVYICSDATGSIYFVCIQLIFKYSNMYLELFEQHVDYFLLDFSLGMFLAAMFLFGPISATTLL